MQITGSLRGVFDSRFSLGLSQSREVPVIADQHVSSAERCLVSWTGQTGLSSMLQQSMEWSIRSVCRGRDILQAFQRYLEQYCRFSVGKSWRHEPILLVTEPAL